MTTTAESQKEDASIRLQIQPSHHFHHTVAVRRYDTERSANYHHLHTIASSPCHTNIRIKKDSLPLAHVQNQLSPLPCQQPTNQ
jgi:hypothetical protein